MELKEGMYVRTKWGYICKLVNINDFREPSMKYGVEASYLNDIMFIGDKDVLKADFNITELIECLDIVELYISGLEEDNITQIIRPETLNELKELKKHIKNGAKIKSITTRKMFENMNYKVGE